MTEYKYLGTVLDNKLNFNKNTDFIHKRCQPDLNVKKTKEMLIDFRKAPTVIPDLFIDGVKVERVTEYKYLGTVLDNKLNFNNKADFIHKRCQPRIFCLQKLS